MDIINVLHEYVTFVVLQEYIKILNLFIYDENNFLCVYFVKKKLTQINFCKHKKLHLIKK